MAEGVRAAVLDDLRMRLEELRQQAEASGGTLAFALRHLERGDCLDIGADEPFLAASTIKVPILVALYAAVAAGDVHLGTEVRLQQEDQVGGAGVLHLLAPGALLAVRDLATLMITVSDNSATNILIDLLGIDRINAIMESVGMGKSRLWGKLMIVPAQPRSSNTVTAGELADLLVRIARGQVVSEDACRRMVATLKRQQINTSLPALLPPAVPVGAPLGAPPRWELAHKTGSIHFHEHDCGLLYLDGQTISLAVLTRGVPNEQGRGLIARVGRAVWDAYAPS